MTADGKSFSVGMTVYVVDQREYQPRVPSVGKAVLIDLTKRYVRVQLGTGAEFIFEPERIKAAEGKLVFAVPANALRCAIQFFQKAIDLAKADMDRETEDYDKACAALRTARAWRS